MLNTFRPYLSRALEDEADDLQADDDIIRVDKHISDP